VSSGVQGTSVHWPDFWITRPNGQLPGQLIEVNRDEAFRWWLEACPVPDVASWDVHVLRPTPEKDLIVAYVG